MGRVADAVGRRYGGQPSLPRRRLSMRRVLAVLVGLLVIGMVLLAAVLWLAFAALGWLGIDSTMLRDLARDYLGTWVSSWFSGAGAGG